MHIVFTPHVCARAYVSWDRVMQAEGCLSNNAMAEAKDGKRREGMVVIAVRSLLSDGEIARGGVGAFRGERGIMG